MLGSTETRPGCLFKMGRQATSFTPPLPYPLLEGAVLALFRAADVTSTSEPVLGACCAVHNSAGRMLRCAPLHRVHTASHFGVWRMFLHSTLPLSATHRRADSTSKPCVSFLERVIRLGPSSRTEKRTIHRGTSLIRKCPPLGPYSKDVPGTPLWSKGVGVFL